MVALVGPTAIGKTDLSLRLAKELQGEIVSVDSMQVYRYMDIGTAKIMPGEMDGIPHHLIDIVNPDEEYDAARFVRDALIAIKAIHGRGKVPLLAGGTGLYLKSLTQGIFAGAPENPQIRAELRQRVETEGCSKLHEELSVCDRISADRIHPNDSNRIVRALEIYYASDIPWSEHLRRQAATDHSGKVTNTLQIGLTCDRQILYNRINRRSRQMVEAGLEKEVRSLLTMGYTRNLNSMGSIGYRHMLNYIDGMWAKEEMLELLARDTRRYAKRQYTWFSRMPKLEWFEVGEPDSVLTRVAHWLNTQKLHS